MTRSVPTGLPADIDATFPDRDGGDAEHQRHHDSIHGALANLGNAGGVCVGDDLDADVAAHVSDSASQVRAALTTVGATGARVHLGAQQTIPNDASTAVSFDAVDFDQGGFWSSSAPTRLTVPAGLGGVYSVTFSLSFSASGSGTIREALVRLNGTSFLGSTNAFPISANVVCQGNGATAWRLVAGDYIELMIHHDVGTAFAAQAGIVRNVLELHRIGA